MVLKEKREMLKNIKKKGLSTKAIHSGQEPDKSTGAIMVPIYASSTYVQKSPGIHKGFEYSRTKNPTRTAYEKCIADLEGGKYGFAFASGMAAADTIISLLKVGDEVIAIDDLYGGTRRLFERVKKKNSGISFKFLNTDQFDKLESHISSSTKIIWVETPTNPMLNLVDLSKLGKIKGKFIKVVDNTFASPVIQRPLEFGIDLVMHSATKYLNGHSDMIGGVIATNNQGLAERIEYLQNSIGAIQGPFDAFLALRGLKTLPIRMERHNHNAMEIAKYLKRNSKILEVIYPGLEDFKQHHLAKSQMNGFGGIISFFLKADLKKTKKFLENFEVFALAESLGGVESLIEHPAIMTHASLEKKEREKLGIKDNLIRLSVGIEDVDDLIFDIENALEKMES